MSDTTRRDALAQWTVRQLLCMSLDENLVIAKIVERVRMGAAVYGPLHLAHDKRNFESEAADELADCAFYVACSMVARNESRIDLASETSGSSPALTTQSIAPVASRSPSVRRPPAKSGGNFSAGHQDRNFFDPEDLAVPLEPPPVVRIPPKLEPTVMLDFTQLDDRFDDGGES